MSLYVSLSFLHDVQSCIINELYYISGTLLWVEKLKWRGADNWKNSDRDPLTAEYIVEGYLKAQDNFRMYWINRAGHMVCIRMKRFLSFHLTSVFIII
jgi:carboxypeptidase C (cathepsin A)